MRRLVLIAALSISAPAMAQIPQQPGEAVPVPLNAQERGAILAMCPAAVWANRQQFDGLCEFFKSKFEAAEAKAKAEAEKPAEKKE